MAGGDIYQINDLINPLSYNYDLAGRLTLGTGSFGSVSYTYDGVGNRRVKTTGAGTTSYSYVTGTNRPDAATGPEAADFDHDLAGGMTVNSPLSMVYDASGRLREITDGSTLKGRYFYNGQGQRVVKDECRVFVYDLSGNMIGEYLTDGTMVAEMVYADGMRVAEYRDVNKDPVCTPYQEPPGPAEGFALASDPSYAPTTSVYLNSETLYTLVWSDQIDEGQVTEASAQLKGAKGTKGNYTLTWDPAYSGWVGSYDLSLLDIAKGGNTWDWSATITDALGGSYNPTATLTITEGSAMSSGSVIYAAGGGAKAPVVNSVDPNTGSDYGGELVTVNGRNFVATPSVTFGTVYSPNVT